MAGATSAPLDRLRSKKKPFSQRVAICCDVELAEDFDSVRTERDELRDMVKRVTYMEQPIPAEMARELEDAEARFIDLEAKVEESNELFVFRSIRRDKLDALLDEHKPTKAQAEKNAAASMPVPEWNPDTFPAALCAATCTSHPDLTPDDWKLLWHEEEDWNSAELQSMFACAYNANVNMRVVDMGKGSAGKRS